MSEYSIEEKIKKTNGGKLHGAFMVDTMHMGQLEEDSLKNAVKVLGLIQEIHWINKILDELGHSTKVETEIFHDLIELILNPELKFNDPQIERYFRAMLKLNNFRKTTEQISSKSYYLMKDIEFRVLGITQSEESSIEEARRKDYLDEIYFNTTNLFIEGGLEYEKFISVFRNYYNSLLEKCRNEAA